MTCRTCKWLDVPPNKAGRIIPTKLRAYRCMAPIPAPPVMPASVRIVQKGDKGYFHNALRWPESGTFMSVDAGEGCAFYQQRGKP